MEGKDEQDNRKILITQNFLNAMDYLIDSGKLKSVAEFERITGFRQQRITGMRKSIQDFLDNPESTEKKYYANTDHLAVLHEIFNVSLDYLLTGEKPIVIENKSEAMDLNISENWKKNIEEKISLLEEKYLLIKERLNFYAEKGG
jgi:hypothetical protein